MLVFLSWSNFIYRSYLGSLVEGSLVYAIETVYEGQQPNLFDNWAYTSLHLALPVKFPIIYVLRCLPTVPPHCPILSRPLICRFRLSYSNFWWKPYRALDNSISLRLLFILSVVEMHLAFKLSFLRGFWWRQAIPNKVWGQLFVIC